MNATIKLLTLTPTSSNLSTIDAVIDTEEETDVKITGKYNTLTGWVHLDDSDDYEVTELLESFIQSKNYL